MIKKLYYIIGLIVACFATACSESLEETYDEFSGDGMIRYVGKCADVEVNPGWERLQVVWKHNIDAAVEKVKITWVSDNGSGEMFVDPLSPDSEDLMDTVYIGKRITHVSLHIPRMLYSGFIFETQQHFLNIFVILIKHYH